MRGKAMGLAEGLVAKVRRAKQIERHHSLGFGCAGKRGDEMSGVRGCWSVRTKWPGFRLRARWQSDSPGIC